MTQIDEVIAEVTGVDTASVETVWVYGRALWCYLGRMEFQVETGKPEPVRAVIMTRLVKRYRDGESNAFLVEMPKHMAEVLELAEYALTTEAVEQKMRNCREF